MGPKLSPHNIPKRFFFFIEIYVSTVYKSNLYVLNRFYSSSTTEQKVQIFGPVLVPFPKNGTKKCVVFMKIASFSWKLVENVPNNPKLSSKNGCAVFQGFFN